MRKPLPFKLIVCALMSGCVDDFPDYVEQESFEPTDPPSQYWTSTWQVETPPIEQVETPPIEWVFIPAGSYRMGSTSHGNEQPIHTVTLSAFEMSKTEVTVWQYRACVHAGVCSEPDTSSFDCTWSVPAGSTENHPINCIDWAQARTFAKWVGADLPTEAEWEYAARGGRGFEYSGSDVVDEVAWYSSNSGGGTKPVGTKRANGYGLHDMSGNVWEWVLDEYRTNYEGAPSDGHHAVGSLPECEMICENGAARRVSRGGGWAGDADHLRVAHRFSDSPDFRSFALGLRLRRTLP